MEFEKEVDNSSGIGTGIVVSFSLFNGKEIYFTPGDARIDLTDISEW